jgi:hypothetical protein
MPFHAPGDICCLHESDTEDNDDAGNFMDLFVGLFTPSHLLLLLMLILLHPILSKCP